MKTTTAAPRPGCDTVLRPLSGAMKTRILYPGPKDKGAGCDPSQGR
ncbi:hypothetical protein SAMN05421505_10618, partial [Sinosporangium album]